VDKKSYPQAYAQVIHNFDVIIAVSKHRFLRCFSMFSCRFIAVIHKLSTYPQALWITGAKPVHNFFWHAACNGFRRRFSGGRTAQRHSGPRTEAHMYTTLEQAQARIDALEASLAARMPKLTLKVSEKGAVSLYGIGKWPVTLYASQWERVLGQSAAITAFIAEHADALARKE